MGIALTNVNTRAILLIKLGRLFVMLKRRKHPNKEIEQAIQYAEKKVGVIERQEILLMLGEGFFAP
jgi:hypothetical protein